jgi:hypothetical protein
MPKSINQIEDKHIKVGLKIKQRDESDAAKIIAFGPGRKSGENVIVGVYDDGSIMARRKSEMSDYIVAE